MGKAQSKNVAKLTTEAIANVSSDIISKQDIRSGQSQIISVIGTKGDVNIKDNTFTQQISVDMNSLMDAMVTQTGQQQLQVQLAQTAKAVVSGINLLQSSDTSNEVSSYMKAVMDIVTNIKNICKTDLQQKQVITAQFTVGNVNITGNVMSQMSNVFSSCLTKAVSNNSSVQQLQQKIDQSAVSETKGVSLAGIIIIALIILAILVLPELATLMGAGQIIKQVFFPIVLVVGVVFIILFFTATKKNMTSVQFSKLIKTDPSCSGTQYKAATDVSTAAQAQQACMKDSKCVAYDWEGYSISPNDGSANLITPPNTYYYSNVLENPCPGVMDNQDKARLIYTPTFYQGAGDPVSSVGLDGDAYLDTSSATYYKKVDINWISQETLAKLGTGNTISWQEGPPKSDGTTQGDIVIDHTNPSNLVLYTWSSDNAWVSTDTMLGPGIVTKVPPQSNSSGFKIMTRNQVFLYIGIGLTVVGIGGTVLAFIPKGNKTNVKKKK